MASQRRPLMSCYGHMEGIGAFQWPLGEGRGVALLSLFSPIPLSVPLNSGPCSSLASCTALGGSSRGSGSSRLGSVTDSRASSPGSTPSNSTGIKGGGRGGGAQFSRGLLTSPPYETEAAAVWSQGPSRYNLLHGHERGSGHAEHEAPRSESQESEHGSKASQTPPSPCGDSKRVPGNPPPPPAQSKYPEELLELRAVVQSRNGHREAQHGFCRLPPLLDHLRFKPACGENSPPPPSHYN